MSGKQRKVVRLLFLHSGIHYVLVVARTSLPAPIIHVCFFFLHQVIKVGHSDFNIVKLV